MSSWRQNLNRSSHWTINMKHSNRYYVIKIGKKKYMYLPLPIKDNLKEILPISRFYWRHSCSVLFLWGGVSKVTKSKHRKERMLRNTNGTTICDFLKIIIIIQHILHNYVYSLRLLIWDKNLFYNDCNLF